MHVNIAMRNVPDDGVVCIFRQGRRGGTTPIVTGIAPAHLRATAQELKRLYGSGGTATNGVIQIQGDHRDRIVAFFEARGRKAKKAGG